MKMMTQLNFGGNCEEAFRYYEEHLGGRITSIFRARDLPAGMSAPHESPDAVLHARMDLGDAQLSANDVPASFFQPVRSAYLFLIVDSDEEAERVYAALADGGETTLAMQETFFATRFAQVRDRFGVLWTISHQREEA